MVSISDVNDNVARAIKLQAHTQACEVFLPFRSFCSRKEIKCEEIILEDVEVSKAIIEYVTKNLIEIVVLGASSRSGLVRKLKGPDVPTNVSKGAPDFCTVYVISKAKILSVRTASRQILAPTISQLQSPQHSIIPHQLNSNGGYICSNDFSRANTSQRTKDDMEIKSPFTRHRAGNGLIYRDISMPEADISFASSGKPSTDRMSTERLTPEGMFPSMHDNMELGQLPRLSTGSDVDCISFASSAYSDRRSLDLNSDNGYSQSSSCSGFSTSSMDDMGAEMRRLRLELKLTMEMYNATCKEAMTAKQKARELQMLKMEEDQRVEEARLAQEAALAMAEKEKAKCQAALEAAEAAEKIAELEAKKRISAERKAMKEAEERKKALESLTQGDVRYRKYTIEEIEIATDYFCESLKIGEGGYGPVYKCTLDHTQVAIKVLRPDAAQGQSQFQKEVEILSCIRHPNMVLLLGACPEYGCLVYEYMHNGSLEDLLFRRGNKPPLPWQIRFIIAAEIGTGLLFLHQTRPEPLVHRDLKPANILLDRNFVSKISDVGLARLVPPSVANTVTQYRMTQAAGTFCYIDPEYQQTGMLGIKSDIYSLGIIFLQLITAKSPMGLGHHMERAIEKGAFAEFLDQSVPDWPIEDTLKFAKIALKCAEVRRKDRPDLAKVILPELSRLRDLAEQNMPGFIPAREPHQQSSRSLHNK
ncbi:U-box domain-containing protein [Drosera capensis]